MACAVRLLAAEAMADFGVLEVCKHVAGKRAIFFPNITPLRNRLN